MSFLYIINRLIAVFIGIFKPVNELLEMGLWMPALKVTFTILALYIEVFAFCSVVLILVISALAYVREVARYPKNQYILEKDNRVDQYLVLFAISLVVLTIHVVKMQMLSGHVASIIGLFDALEHIVRSVSELRNSQGFMAPTNLASAKDHVTLWLDFEIKIWASLPIEGIDTLELDSSLDVDVLSAIYLAFENSHVKVEYITAEEWAVREHQYICIERFLESMNVSISTNHVLFHAHGYLEYIEHFGLRCAIIRFKESVGHVPTESEIQFIVGTVSDISYNSVQAYISDNKSQDIH